MGLIAYKRGQGSIVLRVKILNSSVTTGAGLTGLTSASSGLIISTIADNEATATAYTAAGSTIETITTLGTYAAPTATKCRFKEVDSTNHKGVYEIQLADARYAVSSAKSLLVSISGATNAAEADCVIPLRDLDPYDAVRAGLTALPNVASGSAGAIITSGTGTAQLSVSSGLVTLAGVTHTGAVVPTVTDVTNGVKVSVGTGAGQINASGGKVPATLSSADVTGNVACDIQTIKTQAVTCAAGVTVGAYVGSTAAVQVDGSGYVKVSSGTGTGQISISSGVVTATMSSNIKKNQALAGFTFTMVLSTDGRTPATGKTVTATRSLDGGAFGACANAVSEIGNGWYKIDLAAGDLNGNTVSLNFTATACDATTLEIVTVP